LNDAQRARKEQHVMSQEKIDDLSRRLADPASRRGILRLLGVGVAGAAIGAVGLDEVEARRNNRNNRKNRKARARRARRNRGGENNPLAGVPVEGFAEDGTQVFAGTLTVKKFQQGHGDDEIEALAQLEGTLTKNGREHRVTRGVRVPVSIPEAGGGDVSAQQLECEVLNLVLGPISLNLLGLNVQIGGGEDGLDPIAVIITADPTGGILGSLLCSLAGGLGGPLQQIVGLLNQILGILQGL
jgi:hypothetical protein